MNIPNNMQGRDTSYRLRLNSPASPLAPRAIPLLGAGLTLLLQTGISFATTATPPDCPALAGSYAVGNTKWIDLVHLTETRTSRPTKQVPQLLAITPRGQGYTLTWHMPRAVARASAQQAADADPSRYRSWLDLVRHGQPDASNEVEPPGHWANSVAHLGPLFRFDVTLAHKRCEEGWFLVGTTSRSGPADMPNGMSGNRESQLWLSRNPDGSLALRWRERRKLVVIGESRYVTEQAIRLWASDHQDKWLATPPEDLTPLRENELPNRNQLPKCRMDNVRENQFHERLDAMLPPKARHLNRARGALYIGRMQQDGRCAPMPYPVTIAATSESDIAIIENFLRQDPFFAQMASRTVTPNGAGLYTAVFNMVLALD